MGQSESMSSLNADYDLQKDLGKRPYLPHKDKYFTVIIEKGIVQKISIPDPDLTVGWLLSEVGRRYDEHLAKPENSTLKKRYSKRVIIGLKCAMFYPTLDTYLEGLDNSLAPIRHKTTFAVHFAKLNHHQESFLSQARIGPDDFRFLKVIGKGSYSHVVVARKKDSGKLYAIKIIKKKLFKEVGRQTFISESEINK